VGSRLERVVKRRQLRLRPVAARERELDQPVGEPRVLRQQRAVEVRPEHVHPPHALESVLAVVAVPADHAAERLGALPEIGAPAVVLEPSEEPRARAEVDLDRDVADQARARLAKCLQLGETQPRDPLLAEPVTVSEELVAAAYGEHDGAVLDGRREGRPLGLDHVGGDEHLVAVLAAPDVDQVVRLGVEPLPEPGGGVGEPDPAPLAAPPQEQDVAAVGVDVHQVRVKGQEPELTHVAL